MNNLGYFEIQSADPRKAVKFYENVFGWKFNEDEISPVEYWRIEMAGINGGLLRRPTETPPQKYGTNAFVCSVQVEDFDKIARKILAEGGQIALEKFAVPGRCWQGYFLDPDANTFGIFEVDEKAS
jgi:predicted enzyme related to lactoylglutathione lyase